MTGCRHPVSGKLNALDIANLRRGNVSQRFTDGQTGGSGKVQQRHRRALADRHRFAVVAVEAGGSDRAVSHRDLPRANHLVTRHHTGDGTVANSDKEGFFRHGRQMQNTIYRVGNSDIRAVQRIAFRLQCLHIAGHFRRFAQQDIQRQVDRLIVEMVIMQREMLFFGSVANDRIRRAFALTQFIEQRQLVSRDRQHIALLGFVTPDFQRAHARLVAKNVAQFELPAAPAVAHQLRHRIGETARAHIMDKQDWVSVAQLPAAVDHLLAAAFHFRVIALNRGKIEIRIRLAGGH